MDDYGYGYWNLVVLSIIFFGLFLLFIPFKNKSQRLPTSIYLAFIVALYTEMYGFPSTIYILTWFISFKNPLTHVSGHILASIIGEYLFFTLIYPLSNIMMLIGILLILFGWSKIHKSGGELVTNRVYAYVRHPQYLGILILTLGMLIQWITIPTALMWPILLLLYYRQARREEKEMEERFRERYREYKSKVPMLLPFQKIFRSATEKFEYYRDKVNLERDLAELRYNRIAKLYDLINYFWEKLYFDRFRKDILRNVKGKILEVGVGTGKSFESYPPNKDITAIDISDEMLKRAFNRAQHYKGRVVLRREDVQHLSFEEEKFDTVVAFCVFCSVTDPIKGLNEIHRVLKEGGQLLMLEHVRSKNPVLGRLMDVFNPIIVRLGGENINRDTVRNIKNVGFKIVKEKNLIYDVLKEIICVK
ncbi:MAG: methyltransferase domain-containing protein [Candidatus Brockarchaeota archaeon]|nr:methyltransferase domain-containing protein [Candidatus Brockarchaeota archaeon]